MIRRIISHLVGIENYIETCPKLGEFQLRKVRMENGEIILLNVMEVSMMMLQKRHLKWANFIVIAYHTNSDTELKSTLTVYEMITNIFPFNNILVLGSFQSLFLTFIFNFLR